MRGAPVNFWLVLFLGPRLPTPSYPFYPTCYAVRKVCGESRPLYTCLSPPLVIPSPPTPACFDASQWWLCLEGVAVLLIFTQNKSGPGSRIWPSTDSANLNFGKPVTPLLATGSSVTFPMGSIYQIFSLTFTTICELLNYGKTVFLRETRVLPEPEKNFLDTISVRVRGRIDQGAFWRQGDSGCSRRSRGWGDQDRLAVWHSRSSCFIHNNNYK
jgi:hypothetical protein